MEEAVARVSVREVAFLHSICASARLHVRIAWNSDCAGGAATSDDPGPVALFLHIVPLKVVWTSFGIISPVEAMEEVGAFCRILTVAFFQTAWA